ncbi:MAG: LPXTG cell wall anchor domain-containing protein [Dermatophilaceae bacterium]
MSLRALTAAGSYALTATNAAVPVISTQALTVAAASPASGGALPRTGFDVMGFALWGGLFVLVGTGALIVVRRRRPAQVHA